MSKLVSCIHYDSRTGNIEERGINFPDVGSIHPDSIYVNDINEKVQGTGVAFNGDLYINQNDNLAVGTVQGYDGEVVFIDNVRLQDDKKLIVDEIDGINGLITVNNNVDMSTHTLTADTIKVDDITETTPGNGIAIAHDVFIADGSALTVGEIQGYNGLVTVTNNVDMSTHTLTADTIKVDDITETTPGNGIAIANDTFIAEGRALTVGELQGYNSKLIVSDNIELAIGSGLTFATPNQLALTAFNYQQNVAITWIAGDVAWDSAASFANFLQIGPMYIVNQWANYTADMFPGNTIGNPFYGEHLFSFYSVVNPGQVTINPFPSSTLMGSGIVRYTAIDNTNTFAITRESVCRIETVAGDNRLWLRCRFIGALSSAAPLQCTMNYTYRTY